EEEVREPGIRSLGDVPLESLYVNDAEMAADEIPFDTESEKIHWEGESMPGDEIKSLYGFEEAETNDDTMYVHNEEFP
ncbi:hypothetical protein Tco_0187743, partial [Tanacetum coccineum]